MRRWLRSWWAVVAAPIATAGAAFSGYFVEDADGNKQGWWIFGALAFTAVAGAAGTVDKALTDRVARRERQESSQALNALIAEQADVRVAMNDTLEPIVQELAHALDAEGDDRARLLERLIPTCLAAAANLIGSDRVRASFFLIERRGTSYVAKPNESYGRAGRPKTVFQMDQQPGKRLFERLRGDQGYDFCHDTQAEQPPGPPRGDRPYRTYLAVPALSGQRLIGVVTVDSPEPGDLVPEDRHLLTIMATIIGIAVYQAKRAR